MAQYLYIGQCVNPIKFTTSWSGDKMKSRLSTENVFEKEHYRSILNLLIEYQDKKFEGKTGFRPMQFRYVLEKGYKNTQYVRVRRELKRFFGDRLEFLINDGRVVPGCITSKQNLSIFLNNLKNQPLNMIESSKENVRYRIKKDFYNEGLRIQNKAVIDGFPMDKIMSFPYDLPSEYPNKHPTHDIPFKLILYGLSEDTYAKFTDNEKKGIENCLSAIEWHIENIEEIIVKASIDDRKKRTNIFLRKTKSEKIKKALREKNLNLWSALRDLLRENRRWYIWYKMGDMCSSELKEISKSIFYRSFGWIFKVPGQKRFYGQGPWHVVSRSYENELQHFIADYLMFGSSEDISENEVKEYLKAWSEAFFLEDYEFSLDEVEEIIEWCWNNRDHFFDFWLKSLALSRHRDYDEQAQRGL